MIGKDGLSRVYKVLGHNNQMPAAERVPPDRTDQETMSGHTSLPKRLESNHRITRLIDSEVKAGPDGPKGHLTLVMELGEIGMYATAELHRKLTVLCRYGSALHDQLKQSLNVVWVAYYWQQVSLETVPKADRESFC